MAGDLIERLQADAPRKSVVFIAIEKLKTLDEIEEFYRQYVEHIKPELEKEGGIKDPEKAARTEINSCLEYSHKKHTDLWQRAFKIMDAYPNIRKAL